MRFPVTILISSIRIHAHLNYNITSDWSLLFSAIRVIQFTGYLKRSKKNEPLFPFFLSLVNASAAEPILKFFNFISTLPFLSMILTILSS